MSSWFVPSAGLDLGGMVVGKTDTVSVLTEPTVLCIQPLYILGTIN